MKAVDLKFELANVKRLIFNVTLTTGDSYCVKIVSCLLSVEISQWGDVTVSRCVEMPSHK